MPSKLTCVIETGRSAIRIVSALSAVALLLLLVTACTAEETVTTATTNSVEEVPDHQRIQIDFYRGINEPRPYDWNLLLSDADRLRANGFNSVTLEPPVLITERAGGRPRVILEGAAVTAPGLVDKIHEQGFAVFLAPTTASPGFSEKVTADEAALERLGEKASEWALVAEEHKVELFAPLSRCNLVLGTDAARAWLKDVLPAVREVYKGPVAAKVVADLDQPVAGAAHDFELLDYSGYDYLVIDIHPWGEYYSEESFMAYAAQVTERAAQVAERDGLSGVIIGDLRLGRSAGSPDLRKGEPSLTAEQQANAVKLIAESLTPAIKGAFFFGWTLPAYGARDYPAEGALVQWFFGLAPGGGGGDAGASGNSGDEGGGSSDAGGGGNSGETTGNTVAGNG